MSALKPPSAGWSVEHGVMLKRGGHFWRSVWLSGPAIAWMTIFLICPLLIILGLSFLTGGPRGEIQDRFTIANIGHLFGMSPTGFDPEGIELIIRSIMIGALTSFACLLAALPIAFCLTALPKHLKTLAILVLVVPLWSNILIRAYGWELLLHPDSWFLKPWQAIGLLDVGEPIFPGWRALMIGMVSHFLPFMVIPLYVSVERIDWEQAEVARDLGANPVNAFHSAILPQLQPGLVAGMIFVFLPATGQFVIPDLLGGGKTYLLGNAIEGEFGSSYNWPMGAAYCVAALTLTVAGLLIHTLLTRNRQEREPIVL